MLAWQLFPGLDPSAHCNLGTSLDQGKLLPRLARLVGTAWAQHGLEGAWT